jgi:hypothetical protein
MAAKKLDRSVNNNGLETSARVATNAHSDPEITRTSEHLKSLLSFRHESLIHFAAYRMALKARITYLNSAPVSNFATDIYFSHMELEFSRWIGAFHQRFTS